ncbi:MAG: FAD:protein FMN transferase [Candidatus Coproplasma sp.]
MNKKRVMLCAVSLSAVIFCGALSSCNKQESTVKPDLYKNLYAMGAIASVVAPDALPTPPEGQSLPDGVTDGVSAFEKYTADLNAMLSEAENSLSSSIKTSCVYKFNEAAPGERVEIDKLTYEVLSLAKDIYTLTDGYYNPAVYYSVDLYGFAKRADGTLETVYDRDKNEDGSYPLPEDKYVTAFCSLAEGFSLLTLSEQDGSYYAVKPDRTVEVDGVTYSLKIDLGGIGKGWCADRAFEIMDEYFYEYGYFNFASSSMAFKKYAKNDSGTYTVSARDPRGIAGESFFSIPVKDVCLSTSGDYEQYYEVDGVRYCHIIDPTTGSPIRTGVSSVTVVGGSAAEDDALTTALSAMGKERAVEFINTHLPDRTVVMLISAEDGSGEIITNAPDKIKITYQGYRLANTVQGGKIILN